MGWMLLWPLSPGWAGGSEPRFGGEIWAWPSPFRDGNRTVPAGRGSAAREDGCKATKLSAWGAVFLSLGGTVRGEYATPRIARLTIVKRDFRVGSDAAPGPEERRCCPAFLLDGRRMAERWGPTSCL